MTHQTYQTIQRCLAEQRSVAYQKYVVNYHPLNIAQKLTEGTLYIKFICYRQQLFRKYRTVQYGFLKKIIKTSNQSTNIGLRLESNLKCTEKM